MKDPGGSLRPNRYSAFHFSLQEPPPGISILLFAFSYSLWPAEHHCFSPVSPYFPFELGMEEAQM